MGISGTLFSKKLREWKWCHWIINLLSLKTDAWTVCCDFEMHSKVSKVQPQSKSCIHWLTFFLFILFVKKKNCTKLNVHSSVTQSSPIFWVATQAGSESMLFDTLRQWCSVVKLYQVRSGSRETEQTCLSVLQMFRFEQSFPFTFICSLWSSSEVKLWYS